MKNSSYPFLSAVMAWLLAPAAAHAQTAGGDTLEEIVVTAQRVQSTEQKTPISMQVYTAKDLEDRGVTNLQSLAASDPSLTFAMSTGEPYIALRGVSTGNVTETGNPSVAVATDGIFLNRSYSLNATMFDIERVEILRGPQGTLYGRNAVGGVVSIVTAKPTNQFEGSASLEAGSYNQTNLEGMINLPISDSVAMRFSGASFFHDGYRNNAPAPRNGDDENSRSARGQVLFHPTEDFRALIAYSYTTTDMAGKVNYSAPFDVANPASHNPQPLPDPNGWPIRAPMFEKSRIKDWKWEFSYSGLPGHTTVSLLGGWNSIEWHHASPSLPNPGGGNVPGGTSANASYFQNEFPETRSHELRFASPTDQRLAWQLGAYYFQERSSLRSEFIDNYGTAFENHDITTFVFPQIDSDSKAGFGQLTFAATDKLKLTAGARYTKDTIVRRGTFDLFLLVGPTNNVPIHITPGVDGDAESSKTTWLVDADYSVTDQNMIYANAKTGYKAGGFTGAGSYKPETLTAIEVGSKNRTQDGKLQFNADVYYMKYKDQQLNQFSDPQAGAQTVNADARMYGFEGKFIALVGPAGRVELSANYLDATITGFVPPAGYNPAISANIVGNQVPLSPKLAGGLEYSQGFAAAAGLFTARLQVKYEGSKYFGANNFASTRQGANTTGNLGLDYARDGSNWTVSAYVRNVTNKAVLINAEEVYVGGTNYNYSYAAPRTFGVRVSANFK